MILGDICTRACAFCNIKTGKPGFVDESEPKKIAEAVSELGLEHVVVTSVDRDDLEDGGAEHFTRVIRSIREINESCTIEILTPDFNKKTKARNYTLETVNKNIYIFGIAMDEEEKKEVINEANKIYDVEEVIPSIYLATELSRTKF